MADPHRLSEALRGDVCEALSSSGVGATARTVEEVAAYLSRCGWLHPAELSPGVPDRWVGVGATIEERLIRRLTASLQDLIEQSSDPGSEVFGAVWEGRHYRPVIKESSVTNTVSSSELPSWTDSWCGSVSPSGASCAQPDGHT